MAAIPKVIQDYVDGLKQHDVAKIGATVADDLCFVTTRKTMNKREFLTFIAALYSGFPDWHYDHEPIESRSDGDKIIEIRPDPIPGGAPRGIFEQIGVTLLPL